MAETLKILLLLTLLRLLATSSSSTADCCAPHFNCYGSYWTNTNPPTGQCTATSLSVVGVDPDKWNDISAVKSYYPLNNDEWFVVKCNTNKQCGIGASYLRTESGGIRFHEESVGFYWDAEMAFWGPKEIPTPEGWNKNFGYRLKPDSSTPKDTLAIKIDYSTSTIWYRQSEKAPIDFKLPESFYGKPLYAHVQVWNSNSLTLVSTGGCPYCVVPYDPSTEYDWCPGYDPETAPFSQYLFCESLGLVEKAYQSAFIQGVRSGIMAPTDYAKYDIQDWVYLDSVADIYRNVCTQPGKVCDDTLKAFFEHEAESYQDLANAYPATYSLKPDFSQVVEILPATEAYVDFEKTTSDANEAQYTAVIMAPCLQLWGPLADRLFKEGAARMDSAYSFWVLMNMGYVPSRLNAILDGDYSFDKAKSLQIYKEGLEREIDLFNVIAAQTSLHAHVTLTT